MSAYHVESTRVSPGWRLYGNSSAKVKFWGKSVEIIPMGVNTLELKKSV